MFKAIPVFSDVTYIGITGFPFSQGSWRCSSNWIHTGNLISLPLSARSLPWPFQLLLHWLSLSSFTILSLPIGSCCSWALYPPRSRGTPNHFFFPFLTINAKVPPITIMFIVTPLRSIQLSGIKGLDTELLDIMDRKPCLREERNTRSHGDYLANHLPVNLSRAKWEPQAASKAWTIRTCGSKRIRWG